MHACNPNVWEAEVTVGGDAEDFKDKFRPTAFRVQS